MINNLQTLAIDFVYFNGLADELSQMNEREEDSINKNSSRELIGKIINQVVSLEMCWRYLDSVRYTCLLLSKINNISLANEYEKNKEIC